MLPAGELYPTDVRTSAHGFSAGVAKLGALWASVWFNYLDNRHKFWLTASFNVGGFLLTLFFMPDPLRVSLSEVTPADCLITAPQVLDHSAPQCTGCCSPVACGSCMWCALVLSQQLQLSLSLCHVDGSCCCLGAADG